MESDSMPQPASVSPKHPEAEAVLAAEIAASADNPTTASEAPEATDPGPADVPSASGHGRIVTAIKHKVSQSRQRFVDDGVDLDLTYITKRVVAMGLPASGVEGMYRNNIDDVVRMLNHRHPNQYLIFNLSQKQYDESKDGGVTIPSQKRYVRYFGRIVDGYKPSVEPWVLRRIIVSSILMATKDGSSSQPYVKIYRWGNDYNKHKDILFSSKPRSRKLRKEELMFQMDVNVALAGDVLFRFKIAKSRFQPRPTDLFHFVVHTGFIPETGVLRLHKCDLDGGYTNKGLPDDLFIDLVFESNSAPTAVAAMEPPAPTSGAIPLNPAVALSNSAFMPWDSMVPFDESEEEEEDQPSQENLLATPEEGEKKIPSTERAEAETAEDPEDREEGLLRRPRLDRRIPLLEALPLTEVTDKTLVRLGREAEARGMAVEQLMQIIDSSGRLVAATRHMMPCRRRLQSATGARDTSGSIPSITIINEAEHLRHIGSGRPSSVSISLNSAVGSRVDSPNSHHDPPVLDEPWDSRFLQPRRHGMQGLTDFRGLNSTLEKEFRDPALGGEIREIVEEDDEESSDFLP